MSKKNTRRDFIKTSAAVGAGVWVAGGATAKASVSALEEIRFACIGIGGKGSSDSLAAANNGKVVAVCDIDESKLRKHKDKFPGATQYHDYRKMLEEKADSIDAVTISTPDHTHAVASLQAMRMGKHCFTQKPLTHSIQEARVMGEAAREAGIVTQMGNQGTALNSLRLSAAHIRNGAVGTVQEVHVWTNRPVWPQSLGLKIQEEPAPADIHWNEWIGPAKMRPYSPEIHPFKWRGFWEFGTGALGDMACHTLNMSFMALDLFNPTSVVAECTEHDGSMYPKSSKITFEFPEYEGRPALKMFWYDGGELPPEELFEDCPQKANSKPFESGALIVGDEGRFFSPGDYGGEVRSTGLVVDGEFIRQDKIEDQPEYVRSPGHFEEFAAAIKGEGKTVSNFPDYAGPLTETILLGNLAVWSGEKVNWDAENMQAENATDEINKIIRHEYHNGYSIEAAAVGAH